MLVLEIICCILFILLCGLIILTVCFLLKKSKLDSEYMGNHPEGDRELEETLLRNKELIHQYYYENKVATKDGL